jgi:hypothetical protein
VATNNHALRPAVAVNAQGRGAIALVGPDYPSAAFVNIDTPAVPWLFKLPDRALFLKTDSPYGKFGGRSSGGATIRPPSQAPMARYGW